MPTFTEENTENHFVNSATGEIEIQISTVTLRDGQPFARSKHITVLPPGADLTGCSDATKAIATATWTPANVTAWTQDFVALQETQRAERAAATQALDEAIALNQARLKESEELAAAVQSAAASPSP
jgi:hypothetical protein